MHKKSKKKVSSFFKKYREWYTPVLLRPMKAKAKTQIIPCPHFATIDIETQDWINFVCGGVYWFDHSGKEQWFETDDMTALMNKCFEIAALYKITNFVAHYGGKFDFLFFIKEFLTKMSIGVENIIPRGSSLLCFDAIQRPLEGSEKPGNTITFRDSSALLAFGLGTLTKSFNVETLKGEMDFLFVEKTYKEIDYLDDIIPHPSCLLFYNGKQVKHITKAQRRKREKFRYWNFERFNIFPFTGKISYVAPYMLKLKKDKKTKEVSIVENDWFHEVTFPLFTREDLLKYLFHDCKSLYQVIKAFFEAPLIRHCKKKWTTASQAVEVFRLFLKEPLHSIPDDDIFFHEGNVDAFVRQAYFGGRTEIFKPVFDNEILGKDFLYYYDVNSLFPYAMMMNEFGDQFIGWLEGQEDYDKYEMSIWHCKVRVPEDMYAPPLGCERDNRFVFPVGEFKGHWTRYELEYAKSLGCEILELYEGAAFENAGYVFKEFIETLYAMRLEAKDKGDNVTQMTMKLIMNSCYGRMGINKDRTKIVIDDGTVHNLFSIADIETDLGLIRLAEKSDRARNIFSNPAIACFVTSYSRVHLHKQIMIVGPKSVYYVDTDSCFTDKPMATGPELGLMKLEYKCKSACFLLPKTYINKDIIMDDGKIKSQKLTMKGFDFKNIRNAFSLEDFYEYLSGDIRNISVSERPKFATFKTALKMGEFVTMKNDPVIKKRVDERREAEYFAKTGKKKKFVKEEYKMSEKSLQGDYTKRLITKNGFDTEPLKLYE